MDTNLLWHDLRSPHIGTSKPAGCIFCLIIQCGKVLGRQWGRSIYGSMISGPGQVLTVPGLGSDVTFETEVSKCIEVPLGSLYPSQKTLLWMTNEAHDPIEVF